ncbi:hypothetical protein CCP2SC5_70075 [Azospirillaceae bacterium]
MTETMIAERMIWEDADQAGVKPDVLVAGATRQGRCDKRLVFVLGSRAARNRLLDLVGQLISRMMAPRSGNEVAKEIDRTSCGEAHLFNFRHMAMLTDAICMAAFTDSAEEIACFASRLAPETPDLASITIPPDQSFLREQGINGRALWDSIPD